MEVNIMAIMDSAGNNLNVVAGENRISLLKWKTILSKKPPAIANFMGLGERKHNNGSSTQHYWSLSPSMS